MAADMKETINVTVVQNWTLYWDVTTARDDIRFPETASNVMFVVVSVFSVLGTVANLLTLTALTRNPRLCRRATTTFVLNLALADCVFSCATGPLDAAVFYHRYWPYSTSLCTAVALLRHLTVGASLFSIQLITINRYMSVFHPSWYCTSGGSCLLMVATSWIAPAVLLLPPTIRTSGSFGYDSREASCTISRGSDSLYKAFLYLSSACIPIVTFLRCYPSLFLALRRSQRRLTLHSVSAMKLESIATQDKTFVNVNSSTVSGPHRSCSCHPVRCQPPQDRIARNNFCSSSWPSSEPSSCATFPSWW
ncbi:protein trapped in endoderm-1-like isoform X2 [Ornithodoros turicata]|uniref:protein trapped in endoderm-1-like isoform X2 n=1 Tax=Ornithodoros turicata TaxID=34597 RepID=UPI0031393CFF